jgi:hypothetical protein
MSNETPRGGGDKSKSRYFFCETDFTTQHWVEDVSDLESRES